jgi:uncharacterized repeat protein (TIGR03803 family)
MSIFTRSQFANLLTAIGFSSLLAVSVATAASASKMDLHAFRGGSDGALPGGGLVGDDAGNLFGVTIDGGTGTRCDDSVPGCGTIFEISKGGHERVLYSFQGENDGSFPQGALLVDASGNLDGTAFGGAGASCQGAGCGVVFRLAPDGTETVLYNFQGGNDGQYPEGNLIADKNGNLYGMAGQGGNYNGTACEEDGCGTVFEVQPDSVKTTLYAFQGGTDGAAPEGGVIADASGNLYGMTGAGGGAACNDNGCGTVFKLTPGGTETTLYAFQGGTDGEIPLAGLIADSAGNLYGTTFMGGAHGAGTVFEVSPTGQETVLYSFKAGNDGANPEAGLVMDKKGDLYGTTVDGGGDNCKGSGFVGCGTIFEVTQTGKESILFAFRQNRGETPTAALLMGKHGDLYGTTMNGGKHKYGVAFVLKK